MQFAIVEGRMLRYLTTLLAALFMSFGLVACDDEEEIETPQGEVEVEEGEVEVEQN